MPRNGGCVVDVGRGVVRDRDGGTYAIDELLVADGSLYYARHVGGDVITYQWRWILPAQDLVINRFTFGDAAEIQPDWYIETDLCVVEGDVWSVRDGYLDLCVWDGVRYELEDAGELGDGVAAGEIAIDHAVRALRALDGVCERLRANGCSGAVLLGGLAPGLARFATAVARH